MGKLSVHWLLLKLYNNNSLFGRNSQPDHMGKCYTGSNDTGQMKGEKRDFKTDIGWAWQRSWVPEGSRTSVQSGTWAGLSSVFGMGTGVALPLWPPHSPMNGIDEWNLSMTNARQEVMYGAARLDFAWTGLGKERMVSKRGLNTSLPWCLHPVSIKPVFYRNP